MCFWDSKDGKECLSVAKSRTPWLLGKGLTPLFWSHMECVDLWFLFQRPVLHVLKGGSHNTSSQEVLHTVLPTFLICTLYFPFSFLVARSFTPLAISPSFPQMWKSERFMASVHIFYAGKWVSENITRSPGRKYKFLVLCQSKPVHLAADPLEKR